MVLNLLAPSWPGHTSFRELLPMCSHAVYPVASLAPTSCATRHAESLPLPQKQVGPEVFQEAVGMWGKPGTLQRNQLGKL